MGGGQRPRGSGSSDLAADNVSWLDAYAEKGNSRIQAPLGQGFNDQKDHSQDDDEHENVRYSVPVHRRKPILRLLTYCMRGSFPEVLTGWLNLRPSRVRSGHASRMAPERTRESP